MATRVGMRRREREKKVIMQNTEEWGKKKKKKRKRPGTAAGTSTGENLLDFGFPCGNRKSEENDEKG